MDQHQTELQDEIQPEIIITADEDPEVLEQARAIVDIISDIKGENIVLMDLREVTIISDYFIICSGNSDRQLKAIIEHISDGVREKFGRKPMRTEGNSTGGWVLMDYADIVIHAFTPEQREYYDLEELWRDGKTLLHMQ